MCYEGKIGRRQIERRQSFLWVNLNPRGKASMACLENHTVSNFVTR